MTPEKIELGKFLFFEPRISASGVISCATCHNPALGYIDRIPRATGHDGQVGERNTPTVQEMLGLELPDDEVADFEAFLDALTGQIPQFPVPSPP